MRKNRVIQKDHSLISDIINSTFRDMVRTYLTISITKVDDTKNHSKMRVR